MKYIMATLLILIGCFLGSCSKSTPPPTIEEEIAALPDVWISPQSTSITSNNWNMLNHISSLSNEVDRIRLFRLLFSRFDHAPEWYLNNPEEMSGWRFADRLCFMRVCISRLAHNKMSSPHAILAGWELARDLELKLDAFKLATKPFFEVDRSEWNIPDLERKRREFALEIRDKDEKYFKYQFAGNVYVSYKHLPEEYRPTFVEQIKRDFFHRPEMKFVDKNRLPAPFRTPLDVNAVQ